MNIDTIDVNNWKYHGEGNKSIVVCDVQLCHVLRFLKLSIEDADCSCQTPEEAEQLVQDIVAFNKHVMGPLLGENYVHCGEAVKLPADFVRALSMRVEPDRPESRASKVMDTVTGWALCLPNLTQLPNHRGEPCPTISIEIKPKCGFIPVSKHVTKDVKLKVCRFCMHQQLKMSSGKWKQKSHYCPLDLFSGNRQRMHLAIKHLLEEPQNNLKIFQNGELIYSCQEDAGHPQDLNHLAQQLQPYLCPSSLLIHSAPSTKIVLSELVQVITTALLASGSSAAVCEPRRSLTPTPDSSQVCQASSPLLSSSSNANSALPQDCVLSKILQTQMLDDLDIDGIYPLYKRVERYLRGFPEERRKLQLDGQYHDDFLKKVKQTPHTDDGSVEYAVAKIQQYRVAMSAKDCSIMVTLAPCEGDNFFEPSVELHASKPRFRCAVSVLDLDPKPYENIPHQYIQDCHIVATYLRSTPVKQEMMAPSHRLQSKECTCIPLCLTETMVI